MRKQLLQLIFASVLFLNACKKNDTVINPPLAPAKGVYVLSEGSIGGNNTKLGFYTFSPSAFSGDYFAQQNTGVPGLGDTGNDMIVYGGKMYIIMNVSSQVVVMNATTGSLISRIDFKNGTVNKLPRYATATRGKVYVTSYDNTVSVIDTSSLNIVQSVVVGANPDGIAANGDYLYVANSGSYNFPNVDSTVSIIDLNSMTEIRKVTVGKNPNKIDVATNGDVYVSCYGNFSSVPASVSIINSSTNTLQTTLNSEFQYSHVRMYGDIAYFYNNYGGAGTAKVYNTITKTVIRNEFITDGTTIAVPYGINIDEQNGDVYIMDAVDYTTSGYVTCFDKDGRKKFGFSVTPGINPNKVLFKR